MEQLNYNNPGRFPKRKGRTMTESHSHQALQEQYLIALAEATFPLKQDAADLEVTLECLIEAAGMLKEHLARELAELRAEQD
jgi:hypothetical protein